MFHNASRRARRLATVAMFALGALGFAFYQARPAEEPIVFAMSVQDPEGGLLASPVVVGASGRKVEVRLMCDDDPRLERMSLVLDPISTEDGAVTYSYVLSVSGSVERAQGTVQLRAGAEKRIAVHPAGAKGVTLALYAAPLKHPGVERYLRERRARLGRTST
jgi:hypothetical protein